MRRLLAVLFAVFVLSTAFAIRGRAVEIAGRAALLDGADDATAVASGLADELHQLSEALHEIDRHEHPHVPTARDRGAMPRADPGSTSSG